MGPTESGSLPGREGDLDGTGCGWMFAGEFGSCDRS
jgi:hypothetical protein